MPREHGVVVGVWAVPVLVEEFLAASSIRNIPVQSRVNRIPSAYSASTDTNPHTASKSKNAEKYWLEGLQDHTIVLGVSGVEIRSRDDISKNNLCRTFFRIFGRRFHFYMRI